MAEPAEIAVRGPKLTHAMLATQRCNASVVDPRACYLRSRHQRAQLEPVLLRFREQRQRWRFQPGVNLIKRERERCWRIVNAGVRDDRQEFVDARPWNGPRRAALRE